MKKHLSLTLGLLLTLTSTAAVFGAEAETTKTVSWGMGIPYGIIGCNLEVDPVDQIGFTGGVGLSPDGLGWAVGGRVYLLDQKARVRPRLGIYYGTTTFIEYPYDSYEAKKGTAAGFGMDIKINNRCSIDTEIIYLISYEDEDDPNIIEDDSHFKISTGFRKRF